MGPSHTRGCAHVSEPLRNVHQWYSELYILLRHCIYMRLVLQSQLHSPEERNVFPRRTYAAPK